MAARNVLLLPGMMCDARMWQAQIDALDVPVLVPYLGNHDNLADMAASVLADAPDEFAIAGLSMGGILAFELWRQAPQRVSHLALIDTNPFADAPQRKSLRLEQIEQVLAGELRKLTVESLKPLYLAQCNRDNHELLETILDMAVDLGPEVFRRQSLALQNRQDSTALLADIRCPAAVICGREDALCPVAYHEYMAARIPGADLLIIDDCGHFATMEQPAAVSNELLHLFAQESLTGENHAQRSG